MVTIPCSPCCPSGSQRGSRLTQIHATEIQHLIQFSFFSSHLLTSVPPPPAGAICAVSGVAFFFAPAVRFSLPRSRQPLRAWKRAELPTRVFLYSLPTCSPWPGVPFPLAITVWLLLFPLLSIAFCAPMRCWPSPPLVGPRILPLLGHRFSPPF